MQTTTTRASGGVWAGPKFVERAAEGGRGRFGAVRTFAAGHSQESTARPRVNDEVGVVARAREREKRKLILD